MKSRKKVMLGIPAFDGACPEALEGFMCMAYHLGRREPEYDFYLRVIGRKEQFRARNTLVQVALGSGMDYLWMLDGDHVVGGEVFSKLIAHKKHLIGALYLQKAPPYKAVVLKKNVMCPDQYQWDDDYPEGLIEVDVLGGGCMLISCELLAKVKEPVFVPETEKGTDVQLCERARELGYKAYIDTTIEIGHVCDPTIIYPSMVPREARKGVVPLSATSAKKLIVAGDTQRKLVQEFLGMDNAEYDRYLHEAFTGSLEVWSKKARETDADIVQFYYDSEKYNLIRQTHYNINSQWAQQGNTQFIELGWLRALGVESVLDYGCGISFLSSFFLEQGFDFTCADLKDTLPLQYLEWRRDKLKQKFSIIGVTAEHIPLPRKYDFVMMWDTVEHLTDPWKVLDKVIGEHLTERGLFATNVHLVKFATAPQCPWHLVRVNQYTFVNDIYRRYGLKQNTARPYLFKKEVTQ